MVRDGRMDGMNSLDTTLLPKITCVGFGEAAQAFVSGWRGEKPLVVSAYDIKTEAPDAAVRAAKRADYAAHAVAGAVRLDEALAGAALVFSVVTADQALVAAQAVAGAIAPGTFYFDCKSCAPDTKRRAAEGIEAAGGRYVDTAVMAPVHPKLHRTPLLISGPHAAAARDALTQLGMAAEIVPGAVGTASSIKMIRSVMIKGLEALVAECVLAGRKAGVDEVVLDSLEASFPGFGWRKRAPYMLERMMTHGIRRAAEMREVALTVEHLGLDGAMAAATVLWQQKLGDLRLDAQAIGAQSHAALADAILARLED